MRKIWNYVQGLRFMYWKRRIEGNWYFSDVVYCRDAKRIQKNTTVNKRKWNLVISPNSYVMYGDAPLTVANMVTMEGHYSLRPDGSLTAVLLSVRSATVARPSPRRHVSAN